MSFYRALTKHFVQNFAHQKPMVPWYHQEQTISALEMWWKENGYPLWFRYVKGPYERYNYEREVAHLRGYGLMYDDCLSNHDPTIERALEILPQDLMIGRYRRQMRAVELSCRKQHLPVEEQNYDPYIPYMAPFIEEAKFMLQEEQELIRYHPWDRRLYSAGVTGFGESTPHSAFTAW
mmetsp:Transcript_28576/g.51943  ORF Transcript_28576/g.51943 Transcript_28576/m.51943 type:complete len:178 (+) Transcript_28576:71-604(+)